MPALCDARAVRTVEAFAVEAVQLLRWIEGFGIDTGYLSISLDDFEFQDWPEFDKYTHEFIDGLKSISGQLALANSVFTVAIYYNANETVVLLLRISSALIKRISDMSFSLDATGYPCSDGVTVVVE